MTTASLFLDAPAPPVKYPGLWMKVYHHPLIRAGQKTTTLRSHKLKAGIYRLQSLFQGKARQSDILVRLTPADGPPVVWRELSEAQQLALAKTEGYSTIERFEALRNSSIAGMTYFLDHGAKYWLHHIEYVKGDEGE